MKYKMVSNHPEDLAGGRFLEPGEEVELSDEELKDPHNARLLDEGKLLDVEANMYEEGSAPKKSKDKEG